MTFWRWPAERARAGARDLSAALARVPATTEGLYLCGAIAIILLRLVSCTQLIIVLANGAVAHATNASVALGLAGLFLLQSVYLIASVAKRRSPLVPVAATMDVLVMAVVMLGQVYYSPWETRFSTWDAWGFGVSMSTVLVAGIALPRWRHSLVAAAVLAGSYLASVAPAGIAFGQQVTVFTNASGLVANVVVCRMVWTFVVLLAHEADRSRKQAAESARGEERALVEAAWRVAIAETKQQHEYERRAYEGLIHDTSGLLGQIPHHVQDSDDPRLRQTLTQLNVLVARFRAVLDGSDDAADDETLGGTLRITARDFYGLNLVVTVDQVDDVKLAPEHLMAVARAVRTLLLNAQIHARAHQVVLHGACSEDGVWQVSVSDDGVGFDPARITLRHGLKNQVIAAMHEIWADVEITSASGDGTTVTISGGLPAPKEAL